MKLFLTLSNGGDYLLNGSILDWSVEVAFPWHQKDYVQVPYHNAAWGWKRYTSKESDED